MLTTNKVNISKEILNYNAGFISKDNVNDFAKILLKFDKLKKKKLKILSHNALSCFNKNFDLAIDKNSLSNLIIKSL